MGRDVEEWERREGSGYEEGYGSVLRERRKGCYGIWV